MRATASSSSATREVCPASAVTRLYTSTRSPTPLQRGVLRRSGLARPALRRGNLVASLDRQDKKARVLVHPIVHHNKLAGGMMMLVS